MEVIKEFLNHLQQQERSPLTIDTYKADLTAFRKWWQGENDTSIDLHGVSGDNLRLYKQYLCQHLTARDGTVGLKAASVNRKLAALKSFFQWAARKQLVDSNILLDLPRPKKQQQQPPRWLQRNEQNALIRAAEDDSKAWAIVIILLETGLRVSELCSISGKDVAVSERKGLLTIRNGKGRKQRQIPLTTRARQAFLELNTGDGPVLVGQRGPMTPRGIQFVISKVAEQAGLRGVTVHSLRHSFAKNLVNKGAGLEAVAALCGHENLNTSRLYVEPSLKELASIMEMDNEHFRAGTRRAK